VEPMKTALLIINDKEIFLNKWSTVHNAAKKSSVTGITNDECFNGKMKNLFLWVSGSFTFKQMYECLA